jgi:hypothetical protein
MQLKTLYVDEQTKLSVCKPEWNTTEEIQLFLDTIKTFHDMLKQLKWFKHEWKPWTAAYCVANMMRMDYTKSPCYEVYTVCSNHEPIALGELMYSKLHKIEPIIEIVNTPGKEALLPSAFLAMKNFCTNYLGYQTVYCHILKYSGLEKKVKCKQKIGEYPYPPHEALWDVWEME